MKLNRTEPNLTEPNCPALPRMASPRLASLHLIDKLYLTESLCMDATEMRTGGTRGPRTIRLG